jgi:hypothetical protein
VPTDHDIALDTGPLAPATDRAAPVTWRCDGGLAPDTELLTDDGPTPVAECLPGDRVLALDTTTMRAVRKPLVAVEPVNPSPEVVDATARRVGIRSCPAQPMMLSTTTTDRLRTVPAGDLDRYSSYSFVSEWTTPARRRLDTVDVTRLCDDYEACATTTDHGHTFRAALPEGCEPTNRNGHTGYQFDAATFEAHRAAIERAADEITVRTGPHAHCRPRLFDGDDFLRLLGWFATEGSVTESTTSDTIEVQFAQAPGEDHDAIADLCERVGLDPWTDEGGVGFSSRLFGRLFARLCGAASATKHLPSVVHSLPTRQQRLLLGVLIRGDGNDAGIFYTSSDRLAADTLRLCAAVGIVPRYSRRDGMWRVSVIDRADRLTPDEQVETVAPERTPYYRIAVTDDPAVLAGRKGRFQWVGTSGVA